MYQLKTKYINEISSLFEVKIVHIRIQLAGMCEKRVEAPVCTQVNFYTKTAATNA